MNPLLIVASHKATGMLPLLAPYREVYAYIIGKAPSEHSICKITGVNADISDWSEYGAFFYNFPLPREVDTVALFHYRCLLALDPAIEPSPVIMDKERGHHLVKEERKRFAQNQLDFVDLYRDKIVIGEPLILTGTVWDNFCRHHGRLHKQMILACKKFDELCSIMMIDSETELKNSGVLYGRNMFMANRAFAENWYKISLEMVKYLDSLQLYGMPDRWGGFIIERLFSVYIQTLKRINPALFVERPCVWFE